MGVLGLLGLSALGIGAGAYATIIGAGGGFIVTPVLLLLFPDKAPAVITAVALAVAGLNSASGSINYARYKRIDYTTGLIVAASIMPGAILGAWITQFVHRGSFDIGFGSALVALSLYIMFRPSLRQEGELRGNVVRRFVDGDGNEYAYAFNLVPTALVTFVAGVAAGLMGVGGGIILVPIFVKVLGFPPRIATSTILFAVIFMTIASTATHVVQGDLSLEEWRLVIAIGAGIVLGAQIGSRVSQKLKNQRILQLLAVALMLGGIRLILQGAGIWV